MLLCAYSLLIVYLHCTMPRCLVSVVTALLNASACAIYNVQARIGLQTIRDYSVAPDGDAYS